MWGWAWCNACAEGKRHLQMMFLAFHIKTRGLLLLSHCIHQASWPVSFWRCSCLQLLRLWRNAGITEALASRLYMGTGDSNSGLHTCKASALTHRAISPAHSTLSHSGTTLFSSRTLKEVSHWVKGSPVEEFTQPEMKPPASYHVSKDGSGSSNHCVALRWDCRPTAHVQPQERLRRGQVRHGFHNSDSV